MNCRTYLDKAISKNYCDRSKASGGIWNWQEYNTWNDIIWNLISDVVDDSVQQAFLDSPPEYVVGDDLEWLDDIIFTVKGLNIDSKGLLTDRIKKHYKCFRAAHCTRTSNISSYYVKGIQPLDVAVFNARAREVFLSGEFPELNAKKLEGAIQAVGSNCRENRVYLDGNERLLIKKCAHYLLYGSEYLLAISIQMNGDGYYHKALKRCGIPTVFICDIPLGLIGESTIKQYAGTALASIFQELLDGDNYQALTWRGAGICLFETLPPESIVGHYHPTDLQDPLV